ncbi:hypothetical protein AC792_02460 [Arthrobacter sp. RIT-PI-e]|uniref:DUF7933 domain-containing protein n=1 Tax=Arthrobacter sp. RIT-PI-e TaxID=1681197 RepID=UPI000676136B|nr:LPXTG cell wall anchor domain-containing protein [Arthrobacter sp. RIT-PI-e]KNC20156.1 hypothetical protein AC792_02460 [Arthrobacter sp. RIT-PI-e]
MEDPNGPRHTGARSSAPRRLRVIAAAVALVVVVGGWGSAAAALPAEATSVPSPAEPSRAPEPTATAIESEAPPPALTAVPEEPSAEPTSTDEPTPDEPEPVPTVPSTSPEPVPSPEPTGNPDREEPVDQPITESDRGPPAEDAADMFGPFARISAFAAGVPGEPRQIGIGSFEQGLTNAASGLPAYAGGRYTASTGWVNGTGCTGVLVNYVAPYPNPAFCPTQPNGLGQSSLAARDIRRMADVLGQVQAGVAGPASATAPANGSTATGTQRNHALVSLPYTAVTGGTTTMQSVGAIGITAPDPRFYALTMNAVGARCGTNNASLSLSLFTGTTTLLSGFAAPVVPCSSTGNVYYTSPAQATLGTVSGVADPALSPSVRASTYNGTNTALLTPAQISAARVQLVNTVTGTGSGFGVDDLRVLDVTPALDVSFDAAEGTATVPTTLTYTITNTTDLLAKTDWGFSVALPRGLTVASTPSVAGTCTNSAGAAFAVTAVAGSSSITAVGGDLAAGAVSCTISLDVVAGTPGTYTSGIVTPTGLIVSPAAELTVVPATTITVRKNLPARTATADQFTLSLREGSTVLASATTSGTATGIQAAQISRSVVRPGSTYTISEASTNGAGIGYSNSYECTRSGTVIASGSGGSGGSGTITVPNEAGAEVTCTFTNATQTPRLFCDTNHFYSIQATGALEQADITAGGPPATVGTWTSVSSVNALGIGAGGSAAYALDRSSDASDVLSILKWTPGGGFVKLPGTAYTTVATTNGARVPGSIVAGAVDLSNGRYLFGKFNSGRFHIWSFTETNTTAPRFAYVGSFAAASTSANGDMAFDAAGNLYVVGTPPTDTTATTSTATIYTISRATLAAANGGSLAVGASTPKTLTGTDAPFAAANGVAFSPRGTLYLGNAGSAYEFDANTGQRVPGTPRVAVNSTDLASCTTPSTITVQKNVVARQVPGDQFTLTAATGSPLSTIATATTSGAAAGRQTEQLGPFPAAAGSTITISESMAAGSGSALNSYRTSYDCWANGVRLSAGSTPTGTVTMPSGLGVSVTCTFVNSPGPVAESRVRITKIIQEASGLTRPGVDWTVGVTATATAGSATATPSEVPRQQTDAAGQAGWQVVYGSAVSRATVVVSEIQQEGFAFVSGSCTVNGVNRTVAFTQAGQVVSADVANVVPGQTVECAMVNRPTAFLTLVKDVTFGSALPTDWALSATGPGSALPGPFGRSGSSTASNVPVTPGVAYRLAESGGPLTYVQTGTWQCRSAAGAPVAVTAAGDITPPGGAAITCTVTNATASLTLLNQVIDPRTGFQPADWRVTATPAALPGGVLPTESRLGAEYTTSGNPASTFDVRPGHGYTLSEAATDPQRRLAYQELRLERLTGSTWTAVQSRTISAPAAGQTAVYRFVLAPVEPTRLPLTGGTSADAFYIGGGVLLVLALALLLWQRRRRMRGAIR